MMAKAQDFLKTDIWRIRTSEISRTRAFFVRSLRVLLLAFEGMSRGRTYLRASSLTFYSLLSVVPILAMLFGAAKGFGLSRVLERQLMERLQGQEEVLSMLIGFSHKLLETTQGGVLAGVGVLVLFWSVIKVFGNIEESFNEIWSVTQGRSFLRKITDYPPLFFVCPALLVLSGAVTVLVTAEVTGLIEKVHLLEFLGPVVFRSLELVPMVVLWLLFTLLYVVMPNTRVKLTSALLGGVIAGTLYLVFQQIYITFQIGVSKYNAIYGSFAALPLFLVWLQTSWMIVMVGAELACAHQHVDLHEYDIDLDEASPHMRKVLALSVMQLLVKRFAQGEPPLEERKLAEALHMPVVYVQRALRELVAAGIVSEVTTGRNRNPAFQPSVDSSVVTVEYVLRALEHSGREDLVWSEDSEHGKIGRLVASMEAHLQRVPENVLLKNL